jgi:hypothetical protein
LTAGGEDAASTAGREAGATSDLKLGATATWRRYKRAGDLRYCDLAALLLIDFATAELLLPSKRKSLHPKPSSFAD